MKKTVVEVVIETELGGYRDPDKWPAIYEWMTDRMVALERAVQPHIDALHL